MTEEKEPTNSLDKKDAPTKNLISEVVYTIKPAIIFEYWFGIFRFRLKNEELVPVDRKMKFLGLLLTLIYVIIYVITLDWPAIIMKNIIDAADQVPPLVMMIQFVSSMITTSFFLNELNIQIITKFAELDSSLHVTANEDYYKKSRSQTNKYLIFLTVAQAIIGTAQVATDEQLNFNTILCLPLYFQQDLEILAFCKMINMLRQRLLIINCYLEKFIVDKEKRVLIFNVDEKISGSEEKFNFVGPISDKNMRIRDLASLYELIGETCTLINEIFNFQIFMTLVSTFTYIVLTIWTSLYYYRSPDIYYISGSLITIIIWCSNAILTVGIMSFACQLLLLNRNDTKILVNRVIMDYNLPGTMRVQAKAFMELVEAWPLNIKIYDMFSVDITLMLKFISVATTYLIVIIQISHFI